MITEDQHIAAVPAETRAAARMLVDIDYLSGIDDVLEFLERPHKWEPEVTLWRSAGRPTPEDPGWELFAARARRLDEDAQSDD